VKRFGAAATVVTVAVLSPTPVGEARLDGGPVKPPQSGVYIGAWVKPAKLTQAGRETAVDDWEQRIGRKLDIVNTYRRADEPFFQTSDEQFSAQGQTLMLSWTGSADDGDVRKRAQETAKYGKPVLIRLRWEMDRPNLRSTVGSPRTYVKWWEHTRKVFADEGVRNASWVWCPTGEGFASTRATDYYPGDDQVDWVCADLYAGSKLTSMNDLSAPFLRFAAGHPNKPAMVGEFGVARAWGAERADWLRGAAEVFKTHPQIRAVLYFESDPLDNSGAREQFSLADDPRAVAAFRDLDRTLNGS
jgi:hypothetical protein